MKSFTDLSIEELKRIMQTGRFPDNIDLSQIIIDPKLSKLLQKPHKLAERFLEEKDPKLQRKTTTIYIPSQDTKSLKERSLQLKAEQIDIAKMKINQKTVLYQKIDKMETSIKQLRIEVKTITEALKELLKSYKKGGEKDAKGKHQ